MAGMSARECGSRARMLSAPNILATQRGSTMKRILAAAAGLVLPALIGVAVATPASASPAGASPASAAGVDCPANTFCLYPSKGYKGTQYTARPGYDCISGFVRGIDNNANAMRNYTSTYIRLYDLPGCVGTLTYTANPASYDSNFDNNKFTDKASSMKRV
jgi:hypothetical protein